MPIKAIGFDIDGTLYPSWMMFLCGSPSFFLKPRALLCFGRTRSELRRKDNSEGPISFRHRQALAMARCMGTELSHTETIVDRYLYTLWERTFRIIRPFPGLRKALEELSGRGYVLGALSDFPVANKLKTLGVADLFRYSLSAEESGFLKPHPAPFELFAGTLGLDPSEILYVGNSHSKDILGAKKAGMRTALIKRRPKPTDGADIVFSSYYKLPEAVKNLDAL